MNRIKEITLNTNYTIIIISFVLVVLCTPIIILEPKYAIVASLLFLIFSLKVVNKKTQLEMDLLGVLVLMICVNVVKTSLGPIIIAILIGIYLYNYLFKINMGKLQNVNIFKQPNTFFVFWLVYAVFQLSFTVRNVETDYQLKVLILGIIIIWFVSLVINSIDRLNSLYKLWGYSILVAVMVGWWELISGNHISGHDFNRIQNKVTVGFFNVNDFCYFLIICLPIVFHWINRGGLYKISGIFMLMSFFYFTYVNGARFIMLLLAASLVTYLMNKFRKNMKFLLLCLILIPVLFGIYFEVIIKYISIAFSIFHQDESQHIRTQLTLSVWNVFKEHPFGVGSGNLDYYMSTLGLSVNGVLKAHNFWIEILATYGFIIFIGFVHFFIVSLKRMYQVIKSENISPEIKSLIKPTFYSAILFIPACIESSSVIHFTITWFLFSVIICVNNLTKVQLKKVTKNNTVVAQMDHTAQQQ